MIIAKHLGFSFDIISNGCTLIHLRNLKYDC